jgi:hypothetical protein
MSASVETAKRHGPLSLPARVVGVLTSPRRTFSAVVETPRWADLLLLITMVWTAAIALFLATEHGPQALLDQQVATRESFGQTIDDGEYAAMQARLPETRRRYVAAVLALVPAGTIALAAAAFGVFNGLLGGHARFGQVLAVVAHAAVVLLARAVCVLPLNVLRESMSNPFNAGALLPLMAEGSFVAALLGTIDLFVVWWLLVLALGLGVLYGRRVRPIATVLTGAYAGFAVAIAAVVATLGPS